MLHNAHCCASIQHRTAEVFAMEQVATKIEEQMKGLFPELAGKQAVW